MEIKLGNNRGVVLVDDEDYLYLNRFKWYLHNNGYAIKNGGQHKYMHRMALDAPKGWEIDHINRNKLDNRKVNLRFVNRSENNLNTRIRSDNKSGYKNINYDKSRSKWVVAIHRGGKRVYIKRYDTIEAAIEARNSFLS